MRDEVGIRGHRKDAQSVGMARAREWEGLIVAGHGNPNSCTSTNPLRHKIKATIPSVRSGTSLEMHRGLGYTSVPGNKLQRGVCVCLSRDEVRRNSGDHMMPLG